MADKCSSKTGASNPSVEQQFVHLGFWVALRMPFGMAWREELSVDRRLVDHVSDLNLIVSKGPQRHVFVSSDERVLSLTDQIDLADWCLCQTPATHVAVSSLESAATLPPALPSQVFRIERFDRAVMAASCLYRMGRIHAEQYVQILGGFTPALQGRLFA